MRKASVTATLALVVFAGLVPTIAASAGAAPPVRYYEGPTSEDGRLRISVVVKNGVPYLNLLLIDGPYRCEDGTQGEIVDDGVGWFPRGPAIVDTSLELSENWGSVAFRVSGHLGSRRGSGTLTFLIPALTEDEQAAQVCTVGEVTWSVERTDRVFALSPTTTVEGERGVTLATGFGVADPHDSPTLSQEETTAPIRHYRGRITPMDRAMAVRTSPIGEDIGLRFMAMGYSLACENGAEVLGSIRPHAYFDATQVMPPARLDLDIAPAPDALWLGGVWLHLHGELDRHLGSGTFSMIGPQLTDDLRAQLCETGEQIWTLWRTDAGF
jgi:hypothetical protein